MSTLLRPNALMNIFMFFLYRFEIILVPCKCKKCKFQNTGSLSRITKTMPLTLWVICFFFPHEKQQLTGDFVNCTWNILAIV